MPFLERGAGITNVDEFLASTLDKYKSGVADAIYTGMPTAKYLSEKGRIKLVDDGHQYVCPVRYARNSTYAYMAPTGAVDVTPQDNTTQVAYPWTTGAGSVVITNEELRANKTPSRLFDLWEEKTTNLEQAGRYGLSIALHAATALANKHQSLATIVAATGTIGGQSPTGQAWWQSTVTASGSFAAQGLKDLTTLYNTISKTEQDPPDLGITTQTVYEAYEATMRGFARFDVMRDGKVDPTVTKGGLAFKGQTLFWDENCISGVYYMLNTAYLGLAVFRDANFALGPLVRPANQLYQVSLLEWNGTAFCNNRARQGKLTGVTA